MVRNTILNAVSAGLLICIIFVAVFNVRLYTGPTTSTPTRHTAAGLRHVRYSLDLGAGADMQRLFPEGDYFTYVLYGLAQVNVGLQQPSGTQARQDALEEARWAWRELGDSHAKQAFEHSAGLSPAYGIFYRGWRNYLLSGILLLQSEEALDPNELAIYVQECAEIADALADDDLFLAAYPNAIWPVDTFPAIVSLFAHRQLVDSRYDTVVATWLEQLKTYQAAIGGLVPHRVSAADQSPQELARATSQTLILRFLYELDPAYAEAQYKQFREDYIAMVWSLPGAREYPKGMDGHGDIDSGPLISGVSLSATTVLLGTARVLGDVNVAVALGQASEALGLPITINGMRQYWFGVLPVGDAFVLWSQTATPWLQSASEVSYPELVPVWWRWPWHLASLVIVVCLIACLRSMRRWTN